MTIYNFTKQKAITIAVDDSTLTAIADNFEHYVNSSDDGIIVDWENHNYDYFLDELCDILKIKKTSKQGKAIENASLIMFC